MGRWRNGRRTWKDEGQREEATRAGNWHMEEPLESWTGKTDLQMTDSGMVEKTFGQIGSVR